MHSTQSCDSTRDYAPKCGDSPFLWTCVQASGHLGVIAQALVAYVCALYPSFTELENGKWAWTSSYVTVPRMTPRVLLPEMKIRCTWFCWVFTCQRSRQSGSPRFQNKSCACTHASSAYQELTDTLTKLRVTVQGKHIFRLTKTELLKEILSSGGGAGLTGWRLGYGN